MLNERCSSVDILNPWKHLESHLILKYCLHYFTYFNITVSSPLHLLSVVLIVETRQMCHLAGSIEMSSKAILRRFLQIDYTFVCEINKNNWRYTVYKKTFIKRGEALNIISRSLVRAQTTTTIALRLWKFIELILQWPYLQRTPHGIWNNYIWVWLLNKSIIQEWIWGFLDRLFSRWHTGCGQASALFYIFLTVFTPHQAFKRNSKNHSHVLKSGYLFKITKAKSNAFVWKQKGMTIHF